MPLAALSAGYAAYVVILRGAIAVAIALSIAVSLDKIVKTLKFVKFRAIERVFGRTPLDQFSARPLPDPTMSVAYPKARKGEKRGSEARWGAQAGAKDPRLSANRRRHGRGSHLGGGRRRGGRAAARPALRARARAVAAAGRGAACRRCAPADRSRADHHRRWRERGKGGLAATNWAGQRLSCRVDTPHPSPLPSPPPQVAIQLPMFNERAVCQSIIDSCCELAWPRERFCVQVLDDSTDAATRDLVDDKVAEWRERGVNVYALRRTNRSGYKAGAMKEGIEELADYDFVAIFDADFKPEPDFLTATVPYLIDNPEVGYVQVNGGRGGRRDGGRLLSFSFCPRRRHPSPPPSPSQARWTFANPNESYLTKAQEISLNYHVKW